MTRFPALLYKLPLALALGFALWATPAAAEKTAHGAILPPGAREMGENRYRSPSGYEETLRFFTKVYSKERYPRTPIADLPGVRAVHLENADRRAGWEGLNLYELNGETRIFILVRRHR